VGGDLHIDANLDLTALPGFTGDDSCFPNVQGEVKFGDYYYDDDTRRWIRLAAPAGALRHSSGTR